jgi:hypothetical protein
MPMTINVPPATLPKVIFSPNISKAAINVTNGKAAVIGTTEAGLPAFKA